MHKGEGASHEPARRESKAAESGSLAFPLLWLWMMAALHSLTGQGDSQDSDWGKQVTLQEKKENGRHVPPRVSASEPRGAASHRCKHHHLTLRLAPEQSQCLLQHGM